MNDGHFRIQKCGGCGQHVFHPRLVCPHCGERKLDWVEPTGYGRIYSTTTVRRPEDKGGPYNVALIDLDEGVRLMSRVDDVAPGAVRIGMRVRAAVVEEDGAGLVVFRQAEDPA
ncbi:MAG: OB-fold domain-containing protein [Rhodobiaceae bacterium]|nr:OB-fold domain-containing protein [Rhodobiaceae bacterium]